MVAKSRSGRVSSRRTARSSGNNSDGDQHLALADVDLGKAADTSHSTYGERILCRCERTLPNGITPHYSGEKTGIEFQLCVCHVDGKPQFGHLFPTMIMIHIFSTT